MRISDWSSDVCSSDLTAYVALSRHREGVQLHYGRDDFADDRRLVRTLSRERAKDMASDYPMYRDRDAEAQSFADRSGLSGEIRMPAAPERKGVERSEESRVGKECVSTLRTRGCLEQ